MTMEEGRVVEWMLAVGDAVEKGATVLVIESEKAEVEIEATVSGILRHVYAQPDETLPCGALLGAITDSPEEPFDAEAFGREHATPAVETERPAPARSAPAERRAPGERVPATPAARRLARELGVELAVVSGTGPGGRVTAEDVEAAAGPAGDRVEVAPGVSLDVPRQGEGDPVLLLPGFGTDVSVFARQVPVLAESYEVFGVNPRGVGSSSAPAGHAYDVEQGADDAAAVADGPCHVVGASLGAAVAIELALRHPGSVRSLCLITPFARASGRLVAVMDAWCRLAAEAGPETLAVALLPWFFAPSSLADDRSRERLSRGLAATLARVPAATLSRAAEGARAWERSDGDLSTLRVPTLVVAAESDLLTPHGSELAARIPRARCVVVPEAGHAVGLEAPDTVNAALLEHLASVP